MARKGEPGAGEREGREPEDFIPDDLDMLLLAANTAATEAQRAAAAGEIASVSEKRRQSKAAVERAEELERTYALLSAEDSGVDHVGYEWALQAAEEETGIAAPEKAGEVIGGLRKVGDALRRLVAIDPKTPELEGRIEELERVKADLFERARDLAMQAIEAVKLKYQGEESEFERTFKQLQESPLTAHLEFPPDSPEAREAALKMEITELLFRPTADLLSGWDRSIAEEKAKVDKAQAALDTWKAKTTETSQDRRELAQAILTLRGSSSLSQSEANNAWQLENTLKQEVKTRRDAIQKGEATQRNNLIRFESNRMKVEAVLETPASEDEWRTALVEWRTLIGNRERNHQLQDVWPRTHDMQSTLAIQILTASTSNDVNLEEPLQERSSIYPAQLVLGNIKYNRGYGWILPGQRVAQTKDNVRFRNIDRALVRVLPKLKTDLPGSFTNEQRAEGWKESKLGALVPPGGDARKADREFAAMLERLSHPIASAERAFDVKGEGGEIKVYTLEQAKDLLRRARRDAQRLLLETRGHLERETGEAAKRGARVEGLTEENASLREALAKAKKEVGELSKARDADALTHKGEQRAAASENRALQRRLAEMQAAMTSVATALSKALERKAPMLGGDKELRGSITGILEELEKQQSK